MTDSRQRQLSTASTAVVHDQHALCYSTVVLHHLCQDTRRHCKLNSTPVRSVAGW